MENILKKDNVIANEVALSILQEFVEQWTFEKEDFSKIEEQYPQAIKAIEKGLLTLDDNNVPTYKLAFPIVMEQAENGVSVVNFKTRIKPLTLSSITKGINISKEQMKFTLKCISHLSGLTEGELNSLEKFDYKVIEQVSTVFF